MKDELKSLGVFNRFEVIDWASGKGRVFTRWTEDNFEVQVSEQDGKRTLKIFINKVRG